jgi:hypothetical protein
VKKELVVLGMVLRLAKRRDWWVGDIEALIPSDFKPDYKPRERWLPRHELERLLDALPPKRAARLAFMVATGARLSEAARARREDVSAERVFLRGTKTEKSKRFVPVVLEWQRDMLERALLHGGPHRLFESWGKLTRDVHLRCDQLEIARCSANDLRRTFAHWMRHDSIPEELVAAMLGHVDSKMVKRIYGKLDGGEVEALVRAAAGCATGVPGSADSSDSLDPADTQKCPDLGSDCRTRTCDPVINRRSPCCGISTCWVGSAIAGVSVPRVPLELRGLAKGAAALSLWDLLEEAVS